MSPAATRLSDSDSLIWRIEGDPVLRSPILVVGLLDRTPTEARLRTAVERAVAEIPRLRQRLVPGPLGTRPRWVDDPSFCLEHHLRRIEVADGDPVQAALDLAAPDVMTAFDPARPLWQLVVVAGARPGPAALVLRFHHTITDGVGGIELAERIFDRSRRPSTARATQPPSRDRTAAPEGGLLGLGARVASTVVRAALDPLGALRDGARTVRSVAKMLEPATEPLSPLLTGRGLDRSLHVRTWPLGALRAAAAQVGGTVNDALLTAVGGGLRRYHERHGVRLDAVRVTMPISIREEDDEPGGNRFTPGRFVLPIGETDPRRRMEIAGALAREVRDEPAIGLTPVLAWGLDRLPQPLVQRTFGAMLRSMDVDAVDVPGLRHPAFFAGARVERLWAFAPPTGAALSVTLVSHLDLACVGVTCDLAAVADPDGLVACLDEAFDEVLALATPAAERPAAPERGTEVPA